MKSKKLQIKRRTRNSLSREEILKVSLKIIQDKGIESLSMRRIAKSLKCSVASPYAHFTNQEEIIDALLQKGAEELTNELIKARKTTDDVFEQLHTMAHTFRKFAYENKSLHQLMFYSGTAFKKKSFYIPATYRVFLKSIRFGIIKQFRVLRTQEYFAVSRMLWSWLYGVLVLEMTDVFNPIEKTYNPIDEGAIIFKILFKNLIKVKRKESEGFFEGFD